MTPVILAWMFFISVISIFFFFLTFFSLFSDFFLFFPYFPYLVTSIFMFISHFFKTIIWGMQLTCLINTLALLYLHLCNIRRLWKMIILSVLFIPFMQGLPVTYVVTLVNIFSVFSATISALVLNIATNTLTIKIFVGYISLLVCSGFVVCMPFLFEYILGGFIGDLLNYYFQSICQKIIEEQIGRSLRHSEKIFLNELVIKELDNILLLRFSDFNNIIRPLLYFKLLERIFELTCCFLLEPIIIAGNRFKNCFQFHISHCSSKRWAYLQQTLQNFTNNFGENCAFCEIPKHEKIIETSLYYIVKDKYSIKPNHYLAIPHIHKTLVEEYNENIIDKITEELLFLEPVELIINHGEKAGQIISHVHFHLMFKSEEEFLLKIKELWSIQTS